VDDNEHRRSSARRPIAPSQSFRITPDGGTEVHFGYTLGAAAGLQVLFGLERRVGAYIEGGLTYAPILQNLVGNRHDSGGLSIHTGFYMVLTNDRGRL
jgi:hypothetical protein